MYQSICTFTLTTVVKDHFSPTLTSDFKQLDTFAKSPTDIGFCDLLEHDIDTAMLLLFYNHLDALH